MKPVFEKSITDAIDIDYREYAEYVISNRAIPCYIDGMKPVGRKILFNILTRHKSGSRIKVSDAGSISCVGYHHGEQSAMGAVVTLAASWNNNVPIFKQHGAFGSRLIPEAAAPRYIFVSLNDDFYRYFQDFDVLEYSEDVEDNPEPKTYLPNIPWILVNGIKGIAVGFACNYLPHDPKDIAKVCLKYLSGKNIDSDIIQPTFPDFTGTIQTEDHNKFKTTGSVSRVGRNSWKITELPIGYTREKYYSVLIDLSNKGLIEDFDDNCSSTFEFTIKVNTKQDKDIANDPIKYFKLEQTFTENYTALDENSHLLIFDKKTDIIKKFIDYRLIKLNEQLVYDHKKLTEQLEFQSLKRRFVNDVITKKILLQNMTKKQLVSEFSTVYNVADHDIINRIISIPMYSMTQDTLDQLDDQIKDLENKISNLNMDPVSVLKSRLNEIIKSK